MTVLYGIGTVLRVILRIALLPVQAVLTLLILVAVVPQALTLWGAEGIGCLKELLARI